MAIRAAHAQGYKYVIKQSRRWICKEDPLPSLLQLATQSDAATFASYTTTQGLGFRTEFWALRVADWLPVLDEMEQRICNDPHGIRVMQKNPDAIIEHFFHVYAQRVAPETKQYHEYLQQLNMAEDRQGYALWDFIGTDRSNVPAGVLWHHTQGVCTYTAYAKTLGLPYTITDFAQCGKHQCERA